jgi:short-chain fatty acids transporter
VPSDLSHKRSDTAGQSTGGNITTFARLALALTAWTERWIPDAFIFAIVGTLVVVVAGATATPSTLPQVVDAWGRGFWELIPFTLQMSLVIITGHVLATSPPIGRLVRRMAAWPRTPQGAVALVAFFAMVSSWFNWGFSLVFSAVLARQIAQQTKFRVDYRALAAASFLGLGSIWAQGLSGSAALQMATPGALQPRIRDIVSHGGLVPNGIISFAHTIFLWQSATAVVVEIAVVTIVMWLAAPSRQNIRTAHDLGIDLGDEDDNPQSNPQSALRDPQSRRALSPSRAAAPTARRRLARSRTAAAADRPIRASAPPSAPTDAAAAAARRRPRAPIPTRLR